MSGSLNNASKKASEDTPLLNGVGGTSKLSKIDWPFGPVFDQQRSC